MRTVLKKTFYEQSAETVARQLLGKFLVVQSKAGTHAHRIWETEAYVGAEDKACHAARGRTPRTEVMFGPPGMWYVYLIYGMYDMLNIVTDKKEKPAAVLIRGAGEYDGPGKLTRDLGISKAKYNTTPASRKTGLRIEDRGIFVSDEDIVRTPRVGVSYAEGWADAPLRFIQK